MRTDAATPRSSAAGPLAFGLTLLVCLLVLVARGHETQGERAAAIINSLVLLVNAGVLAGAYVIAGIGFGRPIVWALRKIPGVREVEGGVGPVWLQAGLGTGAMLWLSHMMGMMGLLSGPSGLWVAWGSMVIGVALTAEQVVRGPLRPENWVPLPLGAVVAAPALAVLIAAACSPPGALWLGARSEGGAYDVLSYHLQLPKEWAATGSRLWPSEHNVYSFLPSYMEAAYLHIAALTRAGRADGGSFVAGSGLGVITTQFLHAWYGVLTALFVARGARVLIRSRRDAGDIGTFPSTMAGASVLAVPWVMVVGSLAYNELGVTAALAAAILVSLDRSWSAAARGAGVGFLMGIACSVKPTALFMVAPLGGLFLLFAGPQSTRQRLVSILAGSVAGLLAMAPWLVRNWLASGNPVFPFAGNTLGRAHWSTEQLTRYAGAHKFQGSLGDRLSLFFDSDRGILNEQWAVLFPLGVLALIILVIRPASRRMGVLLLLGVAIQIGAWLFLTHLQSRFLLPAVVPLTIALGLAGGELVRWVSARTAAHGREHAMGGLAMLVAALVPLSLTAWSWLIFIPQRGGHPNQLLAHGGVELFTGAAFAGEFAQLQPSEQRLAVENMAPAAFINFTFAPEDVVYFLGPSTPLYYVPPGGVHAVVYHTTWDRNLLGDAIRAHPDDPAAWTKDVRSATRGPSIGFVLVDFDELGRLTSTGEKREAWYDPDVTPERLRRWLTQECELVRAWPTGAAGEPGGMYLFRFKRGPGGASR